jgi:hypothetical protein
MSRHLFQAERYFFLSKLTFEKETQKGVSLIWKISKEKDEKRHS